MIRIGILFGGPSREREIAFAGGRTVYDNLDKSIFEPVLLFIDAHKQLIRLDWPYIYKGTIRDFYPPASFLPDTPHHYQVYSESIAHLTPSEENSMQEVVGEPVSWESLPDLIDFAFLSLHGEFGEDGQLQGLLQSLNIPWSGSGIRGSAIGMDKAFQKKLMRAGGFEAPPVLIIERANWAALRPAEAWKQAVEQVGLPMVIRPANQGSSIGVRILTEKDGLDEFQKAVDHAFFQYHLSGTAWNCYSEAEKVERVRQWSDLREGIGLPLSLHHDGETQTLYHPEELLEQLNTRLSQPADHLLLEGHWQEQQVVVEGFITGKEFSCIVLRNLDGSAVALPPTEIIKGGQVFDYRSKYMPGMSRKETPIRLPEAAIQSIRAECERLFDYLAFTTYARIDGFITPTGNVILNDPNTTSGMLPSSFFFHQAAEIGLSPSRFLTYIIYISLQERLRENLFIPPWVGLLKRLEGLLDSARKESSSRKKIAVLLGGYSFERHISVESGRNVYEKLASSEKYEPVPVFLFGKPGKWQLVQLPLNLLLKDNADDIRHQVEHFDTHPIIAAIRAQCRSITTKFAALDSIFEPRPLTIEGLKKTVDGVFIALHGRPGEDGEIQQVLDAVGLPYNGSDPESSTVTINKFETLRRLREAGFKVADQFLLEKSHYRQEPGKILDTVFSRFSLPLVAKPVDDGCSSAVRIIRDRSQLTDYLETLFRDSEELSEKDRHKLHLQAGEEFPQKEEALLESLIDANGALQFMEVTVGLRTFYHGGDLQYEVFEPSEALASGEILSLEEKFLAGEGQNITPARFGNDLTTYQEISRKVKTTIESAARLLGVKGYARVDAFVRIYSPQQVETLIIEVNSLPGMTPATCIFHQAALAGLKPYDFIDQLLEFGFYEKSPANAPEI